jgi:hypothetical protein
MGSLANGRTDIHRTEMSLNGRSGTTVFAELDAVALDRFRAPEPGAQARETVTDRRQS